VKRKFGRRRFLRRFFVFLTFWVSCLLAPFPPLYAADVANVRTLRVTIPAVVQMEGEACALADIALIEGSRELTERVGMLLLSAQNGVIRREQVIDALKVSGLEGVYVELKMPAVVTAEIAASRSENGSYGDKPDENSRDNPNTQEDKDLVRLIKALAAWDWELEAQPQGPVPAGRLVSPASVVPGVSSAALRFSDDSGKTRSLTVRLVWIQPALMLTRSVKRGETLKESDFVVRQVRVNRAGVYASRPSEAVGRSLKKSLSQGEVLALNAVADVPAIEKGKSVTIIVRGAGLTVKTKGEALEDGALGETIKVRNISSKAVLTAVVVANDTVEVKTQ
jgi:flagella basal body P-ring formation protein FlgA